MSTGNGNKIREPLAVGIRFEKGRLVVELDDQREVSVPLSRYPTLAKARPSERKGWKLIGFSDEHAFQPPFGHYDRDYGGFVPYGKDAKR